MRAAVCVLLGLALLVGACASSRPHGSCDGVSCSAVGTCVVGDGQPRCLCPQGYRSEGLDCIVAPCEGVSCSDHGTCELNGDQAACRCDAGYHAEGLSCIEDGSSGPCLDVTCSDHGLCQLVAEQAVCLCDAGYHAEGLACIADPPDPCAGVSCSGHGSCVAQAGQASCQCDAGYHAEGLTCVEDTPDPCAGISCSDHGQCQLVAEQAACLCYAGYHAEGLTCVEDPPDLCADISCSDHGACQVEDGAALCQCDEGYEAVGLTCVETLCHCREQMHQDNNWCTYRQGCSTAADCCPASVPAPWVCNQDYPYIYACVAGACLSTSCSQDSHCLTQFAQAVDDGSGAWTNHGCEETVDPCSGEVLASACRYERTCSAAADCCPSDLPDGYTCNQDYPYVYACQAGVCETIYCSADAHCDTFYAQTAANSAVPLENDGCVASVDPCTGETWYSMCQAAQACTDAADCCPANLPDGFSCNQDYPYLYACEDGRCKVANCGADAQCQTYYDWAFTYLPGWLNLGCLSY